MTYLAYLGLIKKEYVFVIKIYNLMGHTFKLWKMWEDAYDFYKRLRDTARMSGDVETTMYAFKQIGFVLLQMNEKHNALKAFKCQLQVAWHINHFQGEMSAYENIATAYFYIGKLDKCDYYMDRKLKGKSEALFSAQKQISLTFTRRRYAGHVLPSRQDFIMMKDDNGKSLKELFSKQVRNYFIADDTFLKDLGF